MPFCVRSQSPACNVAPAKKSKKGNNCLNQDPYEKSADAQNKRLIDIILYPLIFQVPGSISPPESVALSFVVSSEILLHFVQVT